MELWRGTTWGHSTFSVKELLPSHRPLQLGAGCASLHLRLKETGFGLGELPFGFFERGGIYGIRFHLIGCDAPHLGSRSHTLPRRFQAGLRAPHLAHFLFYLHAHAILNLPEVLFGLGYLRPALMHLAAALAEFEQRPVHSEAHQAVVLRQQRHAILMDVLRKRSDLRNVLRVG